MGDLTYSVTRMLGSVVVRSYGSYPHRAMAERLARTIAEKYIGSRFVVVVTPEQAT